MRRLLPLVISLLAVLPLHGQTAKEFKTATDSLQARLQRRTTVKAALKMKKVMKRGTTLDFYFSKELGDYPWRTADVEWFRDQLRDLIPSAYRSYALGDILADNIDLNELPMPRITASGSPVQNRFRTRDPRPKTIPLVRTDENWPKGLSGRHIALWQSHGRYYEEKTERWEWQRSATHTTVEDLYTQSYVLPFLIPMLENAGACVMTPRERDIQSWEVICDNDPTFQGDRPGKTRRSGRYRETGMWTEAGTGFADTKAVYSVYENPFTAGTSRMCEAVVGEEHSRVSAVWRPEIPESGDYAVYISYKSFSNSTTDAVYTVHHQGGESVFHVNQRMAGGTWVYLGTFPFLEGDDGYVRLTNRSSAEGLVSADAVKFGGGMGKIERGGTLSGYPAYMEGALYNMQWGGFDVHLLDDWEDDGRLLSLAESRTLRKAYDQVRRDYPRQCAVMTECMQELAELEKNRVEEIDLTSACFGRMMGEMFVWREDRWSDTLRRFGMALGQFLHVMDACMDLGADAARGRYNPFRRYYGLHDHEPRFRAVLKMLLGDCMRAFDRLPLVQDASLLKNILCVGLWTQFDRKYLGKKDSADGTGPV